MAGWLDLLSLVLTAAFFGGVVYGVLYVMNQVSEGVKSTKESLKARGLDISDKGVSVKTSKRFDRADYVDATQRGFVKAMESASFGKADGTPTKSSSQNPAPSKRRSVFGSKRGSSLSAD